MKLIIKLFGILMLVSGISLLIKPSIIFGWMEDNLESTSLYISAIIIRLVVGILFLVVAKDSKYPSLIKILGYVFILAAVIILFIGQENFQHVLTSIIPKVKPFAPVSGLFGIAFGAFLIYAFSRNKKLERK